MLGRASAADHWTATSLLPEDVLQLPEIGIEIPVAELYEGVEFADASAG